MLKRWWAAGLLAAALVGLTACGTTPASSTSGSSNPSTSSATTTAVISVAKTSVGKVLVDSKGMTLYWFAADTSTTSACTGSCATYWPPVIGTPKLAAGVTLKGMLGTIKRSNGQLQATYDGHPLYTYAGDTAAGDTNGNGISASGAKWWAMTPSGKKAKAKKAAAASPTPSTSTGSGW
jgi:predicted lipoprotein with Yx(FWY)xxD motif